MRPTVWRGLAALAAAGVMAGWLTATTTRPATARVVVVTRPVAAGSAVTPADWRWIQVVGRPPAGALTAPPAFGLLAQAPLVPGETLAAGLLGRTYGGLPRGRVRLVLPVTAAQSALVTTGDRVDVLAAVRAAGDATAAVSVAAANLPVLGVYTASGGAVTTTGASAAAPALVAVAATPAQAAVLVPLVTAPVGGAVSWWLVADPRGVLHAGNG
jgi:hypothetical protein